jgi:hypothetical protein
MKSITLLGAALVCLPLTSNADSEPASALALAIKGVAQGFEEGGAGGAEDYVRNELTYFGLGLANTELDQIEESILSATRFKYLELTLGSDLLGLKSGTGVFSEAMSVYGLYESDNLFLFNQASLVNFDGRNTVNIGFGARHINDDDTIILGLNAFYDHELKSDHRRASVGFEFITSPVEFRVNEYWALSDEILYNGVGETALNGRDVKLTANLPYFYSSNLYYTYSNWDDGLAYETKTTEYGLSAEILPNLSIRMARQKNGANNTGVVASVSYSIPLGDRRQSRRVMQDGSWSMMLRPIREELYQPVQRENRIMTKSVSLGIVVRGY